MVKFDHLALLVHNAQASRDWYVEHFGFLVEFEVPDLSTIAIQDSDGFTIFLHQGNDPQPERSCALWFQVDDVDAKFEELCNRRVKFAHGPQPTPGATAPSCVIPRGISSACGMKCR